MRNVLAKSMTDAIAQAHPLHISPVREPGIADRHPQDQGVATAIGAFGVQLDLGVYGNHDVSCKNGQDSQHCVRFLCRCTVLLGTLQRVVGAMLLPLHG